MNPLPSEVTVYRTRFCGYCVAAARLLQREHVGFRELDVSADPERRRWLVHATGQHTVPQIFIGERSIGGYEELAALVRNGELRTLLAEQAKTLALAEQAKTLATTPKVG
jgi:glutaredoxin 3